MAPTATKDRNLIAVIGDEDSVTGMLLAGIGNVSEVDGTKNFTVIGQSSTNEDIQRAFEEYTCRKDIAILLINQCLADRIRYQVNAFQEVFPAVLEIPSKDHPYDPEKDSILQRVRSIFGE